MKTRLKALLVEDDPSHARLVERALFKADLTDFDLKHVQNLASAAAAITEEPFDVILLDLGLPDCRPAEALSGLLPCCGDVPIVVLTADADLTTAMDAVASGAQDYLHKGDMTGRTLERVARHAVQRQRLVHQLRDANRKLDHQNKVLARHCDTAERFVDHVSHEFRTPLTVIKEFVTIMTDGLAGEISPQQREYLHVINDRADDLAVMVDDMLDVSKLEAGLLRVWRRRCTASDIIEHVRPILERKALGKHLRFSMRLEDQLPELYCDPEKIGRVIVNLVMNAFKFCVAGGDVELWARRNLDDTKVVFGVTDNGPGIAEEDLKAIFERFHQVAGRDTDATRGFGLGLSIAKELVNLNLGDMCIESALGKGSTFSFEMPLADPEFLIPHYAHRLARSNDELDWAAVLTVEAALPVAQACSTMLDELLQHSFRGDDLAVSFDPGKWLVVLRCPPGDVDAAMERVSSVWKEFNRNRPGRQLPPIRFSAHGAWRVRTEADKVVQTCLEQLAPLEPGIIPPGESSRDDAEAHSHRR